MICFFAVRHSASSVDYTYQFSMMRFNTIDHFIQPHMLHSTVDSLSVLHKVDYRSSLSCCLHSISVPADALTCQNKFASDITSACLRAGRYVHPEDKWRFFGGGPWMDS